MIDFALLSTGQLAALLGGAALATVALYLLKPRKRRVVVPFVALWESVLAPKPSAALFSKLRRLISLLVALLIVALLALSRGGPRWSTHAGKHTVILVDAGAHMQARDVAPTRWAVALREARRLVDARGPADELMIAQLDETVTPVSPMTSDARQLEAAVSELQPSHAPTQVRDGLRLALDVLRNRAEPEIVLISDGVADPASELEREASRHGVKLRQIQIGNRSKNLRVSSLAARRYPLDPSQAEIMLEVENGGDAPADAQLTLLSDGRALDSEPLTLQPHERRSRFYEHIGGADASLSARIEPRAGTVDDLPGDDEASTVLPARTRKHVLAVTPGNRYLEAALLLDEMLDVEQLAPAQYRDATGFDVVIFDGFVPATPPLVPALYLAPKPSAGSFPFAVRGSVDRPFFDHVEDHDPLLRFTALRDVNIAHSLVLAPEPGDQVLAGSTKAPLLVRGTRNGQPMLALAFDVRDSDLPLRAAWPLLLLHALEGLTESPDSRDALRSLGHVEAAGTASLAPRKLVGSIATRIAVAPPPTRAPLPARDPWFLLAALAALIVVVEWCTYQRRWTV